MRVLILGLFVLGSVVLVSSDIKVLGTVGPDENALCSEYEEEIKEYSAALYDFAVKIFKRTALYSNYQFVASPYAIWLTLAAIAEGADEGSKRQLFDLLRLPEDSCIRQKYYKAASSRFLDQQGITFRPERKLFVKEGVFVSRNWANYVKRNDLIDIFTTPEYSPILSGNSVLLDSLEYNGLWSTAFDGALVENSPFYNENGQAIGAVDLMKTKIRAKIGYLNDLGIKTVSIPLGNGDYSLLLAQGINNNTLASVIERTTMNTPFEIVASLQDTINPIDIAMPRFALNSEIDVRTILESLGVVNIWRDPLATSDISEPPAFPSSYTQRASVTFSSDGVYPARQQAGQRTSDEFIANKPFFFVIVDEKTYSGVLSGVYTQPSYLYQPLKK